jgi:hypothetical protein
MYDSASKHEIHVILWDNDRKKRAAEVIGFTGSRALSRGFQLYHSLLRGGKNVTIASYLGQQEYWRVEFDIVEPETLEWDYALHQADMRGISYRCLGKGPNGYDIYQFHGTWASLNDFSTFIGYDEDLAHYNPRRSNY